MADTRADLNANITALATVNTNLIAAIEARLAVVDDFTPEDTALRDALTAAQAELDKISPPPPPPAPTP